MGCWVGIGKESEAGQSHRKEGRRGRRQRGQGGQRGQGR